MTWQTIGFKNQKKFFTNIIKENQLAHAYLFTGPEMIGKQMFAKDLFVLANNRKEFSSSDPDLKIISPRVEEGDSKIYIDDARGVKQFLSLKPYYGPYKFVIINDAERLTPEASNALLKVLEEPSADSIFILISSKPRLLLPTIASRCQVVRFMPHARDQAEEFILNYKLSKDDRELLLSMAQGRIGWLAGAAGEIKEIKKSVNDLQKVLRGSISDRMMYAKKVYENENYATVVSHWIYWLYGNSEVSRSGKVLKHLLVLNNYLGQPQYNHRLLIENTLLDL